MNRREALESLKHQLRIDYDTEDAQLQGLLDAAISFCADYTNRTQEELFEMSDNCCYPLPFMQAAIMLAAHWYEEPTAMVSTSMTANPYGIAMLLNRYVKLDV